MRTAENRHARNVRVFGTHRGEDTESSDIDLLVDLDDQVNLLDLIGLKRDLSELLGVAVDVVPGDSLKPRVREQVLQEAVPL
ncbi:MAG: nucleotidyltransferase domain-containing protein [Microthrixaceae bacterium]